MTSELSPSQATSAMQSKKRRGLGRRIVVRWYAFRGWAFAPGWITRIIIFSLSVGLVAYPLWLQGWKYGVLGTIAWFLLAGLKASRELSPKNMQFYRRTYLERKLLLYKLLQKTDGPATASTNEIRGFQEGALSLIAQYVRDHRADMKGTEIFVNLLAPRGDELSVIARDREHVSRPTPSPVAIENTVVGLAFTTGEEAVCGDIYREYPTTPKGKPYKSVLAIPVKRGSRVLGVVSIDSSRPYRFEGPAQNLIDYVNPYVALLAWTLER